MLFFLHIPKTAGTTFYDVVKKNYDSFLKPKVENDPNKYLEVNLNSKNSSFAIRLPGGYQTAPEILKIISQLHENQVNKIKFIGGHVGYGFHESINEKIDYISFIREPKERIISDFYEHNKKGRHFYNSIKDNEVISFNKYLQVVLDSKLDNILTRQLAGPFDFYLHKREIVDEYLLNKAYKNSENIDFFDINNFDGALYFLHKKFYWKKLKYVLKNISFQEKKNLVYDENLLNEVIKYDVKLYNKIISKIVNKEKLNFFERLRLNF